MDPAGAATSAVKKATWPASVPAAAVVMVVAATTAAESAAMSAITAANAPVAALVAVAAVGAVSVTKRVIWPVTAPTPPRIPAGRQTVANSI